MTNARTRARLDRRRARRRRGRRPFRRGVDAARQGRRIRRRGDAGVRLLGLGRRPLFDLVEHRPAAGDRRRTGALSRIPQRRRRGRRALPRGAAGAQHSAADGARQRVESRRARLRLAGGHSLRPAPGALPRLSPAIADGEQRQERAPRRQPGRARDRADRLGRARHQRPARVLPAAAPGHRDRAARLPRRRQPDRRRRASPRPAARQLLRPGRSADARPHAAPRPRRSPPSRARTPPRRRGSPRTRPSPAAGRRRPCSTRGSTRARSGG